MSDFVRFILFRIVLPTIMDALRILSSFASTSKLSAFLVTKTMDIRRDKQITASMGRSSFAFSPSSFLCMVRIPAQA